MSVFLSCFVLVLVLRGVVVNSKPLVPALIIFGDSVVDVGNNNYLNTIVKANFPPYGRDYVNRVPTGRFCNGKLAMDFTAEYLGFNTYPQPYLNQEARGNDLLTGANFASSSSGLYDETPLLYNALTLNQQLNYYREYQTRIVSLVGLRNATDIISGAVHVLTAGSSDYIQNYYINPVLRGLYSPDQYADFLLGSYSTFIQNLYALGARRIGTTSLPPIGCLPAAITLFGLGSNDCVSNLNQAAILFNNKLNVRSQYLANNLPGLKLVVFDIYQPLLDMITRPLDSGFYEVRRGCCGTGMFETSVLCNAISMGTCSNATQYVFWDGFHPSEAANRVLATSLLAQGFNLIS